YDWLVKDLEEANKNRAARPWIVSFFHRPFYCSNSDTVECHQFNNHIIRDGFLNMPGLEQLFIEQGVDMAFAGHEHSYERFYPRTPTPDYQEVPEPYHNPAGPIYVVTGAAGCHSLSPFGHPVPFSAVRDTDYGYSRMYIPNATHIHFEENSVQKNAVFDEIWISKDKQTKFEQ
ncbi:hypothetical protein PENTCL1PPCAC_3685, partial [Pristionchus entomophagus]